MSTKLTPAVIWHVVDRRQKTIERRTFSRGDAIRIARAYCRQVGPDGTHERRPRFAAMRSDLSLQRGFRNPPNT
jgi:hypothetical protein